MAHGKAYSVTGPASLDLRFPGQWFQAESGLHQNWMRDYDPTTANWRSLSGVGIGLLWTRDRDYAFRLDYAWKTCGEAAADSNDDKNGRIWLQAIKYF